MAGLHGQVAHEIGRQIVSGQVGENELLPREAELASRYGVSRQAVREGLKVLAAKGLVKSRRRSGTRATPRSEWNLFDPDVLAWHPPSALSTHFLQDLIELRTLVEPEAAALAARRGDPEKLARIRVALEAMVANGADREDFVEADIEFHAAVCSASCNLLFDRLSIVCAPLLAPSLRLQKQVRTPAMLEDLVAKHGAVYHAIARRDSVAARKAMEALLQRAASEVSQVADNVVEKELADSA